MTALTTVHTHPPSSSTTHTTTSHRAVEVVASFGGSVVGVRHVADPKSGATRAITKAMLLGGASLLAVSAIAFGYANSVATDNAAAAKAWSEAKKPSWAFRPEMLPRSLDGLILGGSAFGLAGLVWGLSRRKNEQRPSRIRVGAGAGVDFSTDTAAFDLVAPSGDGFVCNLVDGMTGELTVGGITRAAAPGPVPMTADTRLRVTLGSTMFHVSSVAAPAATATAPLFLQRRPLAFIAASAVAHLGAVLFLQNVPSDLDTATGDDDSSEFIQVAGETTSREELVREPTPSDGASHEAGSASETSSRMNLASGTSGTDKPSTDPGNRKVKNDGTPPSIARERALEAATRAGILASDAFRQPEMFSSLMSKDFSTSQFDDADIYAWQGPGAGDAAGNFGHGPSGSDIGGGGKDWDSMKTGSYETIGDGDKTGEGMCLLGKCDGGPGGGDRVHDPKTPKVPVRIGKPTCKGDAGCDTEIIRRYIKRNSAKVAYCYEHELIAQPTLAGTVTAVFMVSANGKVTEVNANGVSSGVSSCVETVIANIQFPQFDGPFQVSYPFHMTKAGS